MYRTVKCLKDFKQKNQTVFKKGNYYKISEELKFFNGFGYLTTGFIIENELSEKSTVHLEPKKNEIPSNYFKEINEDSLRDYYDEINIKIKKAGGILQTELKNILFKWEVRGIIEKKPIEYYLTLDSVKYPAFGIRTVVEEYKDFSHFYVPFFDIIISEFDLKFCTNLSILKKLCIKPSKKFYAIQDREYFLKRHEIIGY